MTIDYRFKKALRILCEKGPKEFTKKLLAFMYYITGILYLPACILKTRRLTSCNDLNILVDFTFSGCAGLIKPLQIRFEMVKLLRILVKEKPKYVLEIGTADGGTLFLFSRAASEKAVITTIDLPGGGFDKGSYPNWKVPLYKSFASPKQQIHLVQGNTHDQATLEKVKTILNGNQIDFLFIDGDHSYEGVKKDFEMYAPLVKVNSLIAFHDIVTQQLGTGCLVSKLWNEIKSNYNHLEIIESPNQTSCGIGLIRKSKIRNV